MKKTNTFNSNMEFTTVQVVRLDWIRKLEW